MFWIILILFIAFVLGCLYFEVKNTPPFQVGNIVKAIAKNENYWEEDEMLTVEATSFISTQGKWTVLVSKMDGNYVPGFYDTDLFYFVAGDDLEND